jgi:hypothetical protein
MYAYAMLAVFFCFSFGFGGRMGRAVWGVGLGCCVRVGWSRDILNCLELFRKYIAFQQLSRVLV